MFIVYRGAGPIILAFPFIFGLLGHILIDKFLGESYYEEHNWPVSAIMFLAGITTWILGSYLNSRKKVVTDPKTGKGVLVYSRHDIYDIKMQYWAIPFILISIVLFLRSFSR